MKIKQFENFKSNIYVHYELYSIDNNGEEYKMPLIGDDYNYNPYDLVECVMLLEKYQERCNRYFFLKKISEEHVNEKEIAEAKLRIKARKYNI